MFGDILLHVKVLKYYAMKYLYKVRKIRNIMKL